MVSRASRRVLGQTNSFCLVSRAKQAIFKHNDRNSTVDGKNMNTRRKQRNGGCPIEPKLKHPRTDGSVDSAPTVLDTTEESRKFLSTIFCLLSPHIWFKITHDDHENDSICNNLGIKSSLFYPLLRKVGLITTKHYQVTVNLKIS